MGSDDILYGADDRVRTFFQGSAEDEERFKYRVIEGMAESIRQLATNMADMQRTQVGVLERLATLEANRFGKSIEELEGKVNALLRDKDRRDGALGMLGTIKAWAPFLAMIFSAAAAAWLYGRSLGITPAPPVRPATVEATIQRDDRTIEGRVVPGTPATAQ